MLVWLIKVLCCFLRPQLLYLPFRDCPRFQELKSETLQSEEFQKRLRPYKVSSVAFCTLECEGQEKGWNSAFLKEVWGECVCQRLVLGWPPARTEASPFQVLYLCPWQVSEGERRCQSPALNRRNWGFCLSIHRVCCPLLGNICFSGWHKR